MFVLTVKGFATEAEARGAGEAILKGVATGLLLNIAQVDDPPADPPVVEDISAPPAAQPPPDATPTAPAAPLSIAERIKAKAAAALVEKPGLTPVADLQPKP